MGQQDSLRALDAGIHDVMLAAGVAEQAVYQAGGGAAVPCRVYEDDKQDDFGEDLAPVAGRRTVLSIFLADVPAPRQDATVTMADGTVWKLKKQAAVDQSIAKWVVTRG